MNETTAPSSVEPINYSHDGFLASICEGVAASWLNERYAEEGGPVLWHGGNTPLYDLSVNGLQIDVKRAFTETVNWRGTPNMECIGFMGSSQRTVQVRDGVTHYFLVVPSESPWVELRKSKINVSYEWPVRMFMIPRAEVNSGFEAKYTKANVAGRGHNRYMPVSEANQWEVFFEED